MRETARLSRGNHRKVNGRTISRRPLTFLPETNFDKETKPDYNKASLVAGLRLGLIAQTLRRIPSRPIPL